jgi:hypothetical protein
MNSRALLVIALGLATFASAEAKDKRPKPNSTNPNVKRAMKKAKKYKPRGKYKAPKKSSKPSAAKRGVKHV